ncbi:calcium-binding protein [Rhizobium sp. 62_C5_N11_2]|uniref:calcium-binding protein n=1 Tax=Rhizobium sp. 62_C5_N11_2 TaxID=3240772 RepID=UPI003F291FBF
MIDKLRGADAAQVDAIAAAALVYGLSVDGQSHIVPMNAYGGGLLDAISLHSQALMVLTTYADAEHHVSWSSVGGSLFKAYFDEQLGVAAEADQLGGYGTAASKMLNAIAYSVLDEGNLIFGNTGARALFDDADALGVLVSSGKSSAVLEGALDGLAEAIVQFAGLMAVRQVNYHDYGESSPYRPEQGVVQLSDENGDAVQTADQASILTLEINQELWRLGQDDPNAFIEIRGVKTLLESLFERTADTIGSSVVTEAIHTLYPSSEDKPIQEVIGAIQFSVSEDPLKTKLPEWYGGYDPHHASLLAATDGDDAVDGNSKNNIIAGSDGDDVLDGHSGRDILIGGSGNDLFIDSVTEENVNTGHKNDNDIYVGSDQKVGLLTDFLEWLVFGTETDTVRYTVDPGASATDPEATGDLSDFTQGLRVTDLQKTTLGQAEAIKITIEDANSGAKGTDILLSIDKVELSDRADELVLNDAALDAPILIDMGKSGRIQSEVPAGERLSPNAFTENVDVVDYSGLSHGINYLNGVTSDHDDVYTLDNVFQWQGYDQELLTIVDYAAKGALGYNNALHVQGADQVKLSDHDDVLISADFGSIITTGEGQDKIWFTNGIGVTDLSSEDRIALGGVLTLYGGLKNEASEDPYAWGPYGTAYALNAEGELVIRNAFWHVANADGTPSDGVATMYVLNWKDQATAGPGGEGEVGPGGIFLAEYHMYFVRFRDITLDMKGQYSVLGEGAFDILGLMIKTMTGHYPWGGQDPLVLDLDGDGIELTALDRSKSKLDLDNDLYAESSGFVGKDDGVLVRDLNGDGKITGSDEMFGNATTSGLAALALLDGNHDGKVDANDSGLADFNGDGTVTSADSFSSLLVWQDANENHRTDTGELKSVVDRGITSINVTPNTGTTTQTVNGNTITSTAGYTLADGTVRTIADVLLSLDNQNTTYVGAPIQVSQSVLDLADLKGRGTLVSLHEALSVLPTAETAVRAAVQTLTSPVLSDLREAIRPILTAWAEGSPVKIGADIITGAAGLTAYDDLAIVRKDGNVVDYAWGVSSAGDSTSDIPGIRMASGVIVSSSEGTSGRGELSSLLSQWTGGDSSIVVTTGTELHNGVSVSYLDYRDGDDYLRIYNYQKADWSSNLASSANHTLGSGVVIDTISGSDFSFYERLIGESLHAFFDVPDSATAGYQAVAAFLDKMDDALDLFAVRLAVQSGPLAHYFDSIDYNAQSDGFTSKSGSQIAAVFTALLADAEQSSDAVSWLTDWKPFFDVFLSDYSRGSASQKNTYAFLVQNMLNAVEQHAGGISVVDFAHAFGMAQDLFFTGTGVVIGSGQDDILIVDGGETVVRGGTGSDNYVIGKSFGSTEIFDDDGLGGSVDTVRFSAHNAGDIIASRDGIDLLLTDKVTGAVLRITNEFEGRWPGLMISDASHDFGINQIVFKDGSVWTKVDIAEAVSKIDDASTHVTGTEDIDVLQGGKGDDLLEGGGDTDIYRYGRGDGQDTIHDFEGNAFRNDQDMLQFLDGIRSGDLIFLRDGASNDLVIRFKNSPLDQITIQGQFAATYTGPYGTWYMNRIDLFTFDDGSSLTSDQVASIVLQAHSTDGNDELYGMEREDILRAGKGDDFISGGNQSDLYLYALGDGHDVIQDRMTNILSGTDDFLRFGAGIGREDISFGRVDGDRHSIVIYVNGGQGSITLQNEFAYAASGVFGNIFFDRIERIDFTSGDQSISWHELATMLIASEKTSGADIIEGLDIDDILDGGAGDDTLYGYNGNDTYVWGHGYGNDTIQERGAGALNGGDFDKIIFNDQVVASDIQLVRDAGSSDLVIRLRDSGETLTLIGQFSYNAINYRPDQVDEIHFSDGVVWNAADIRSQYLLSMKTAGNDSIYGFWTNDTLDGGAGNDYLAGGDGDDTYFFGYGDGQDIVQESYGIVLYSDNDTVRFNSNVNVDDVTFQRVGDYDLLITLAGSNDSLLIRNEYDIAVWDMNDVEQFAFADGTILSKFDIIVRLIAAQVTEGDDTVTAFDFDDVIAAGAGADTIDGRSGNDTITGGTGNDTIDSGWGNDTIYYARGDGNDTITDTGMWDTDDRLVLSGINPADVTLVRNGNDVTLVIAESVAGAGDAGSILLSGNLNEYYQTGLEKVVFADGTIWTRDTMRAAVLAEASTSGNDVITGFNAADIINAGAGNDTINAGDGNDTITGGIGNDTIDSGWGNDTIYYSRGDGNETISDSGMWDTDDRLVLSGINPGDVTLVRNGNDVTLVIAESAAGAGDGDSILLQGNLYEYLESGLDKIVFADGTVWSRADLRAMLVNFAGTPGDDVITGSNTSDIINAGAGNDTINAGDGNDTITGGIGNDTIDSGWGNDTIYYARGDGNDTITDTGMWDTDDRLVLSGINPGDVTLVRNGNDVTLVIAESTAGAGDGGSIMLQGNLNEYYQTGLEKVVFADGTIWTRDTMRAAVLAEASTSGNDVITGFNAADIINAGAGNDTINAGDGNDTITGGIGNDTIDSGWGNDTIYYARGDGNDTITDTGMWDTDDRLVLSGINPGDVTLVRNGNDVTLVIAESTAGAGDGGSIMLQGNLNEYYQTGLEKVVFADGTIWTRDTMRAAVLAEASTSGNDVITGFNAADIINAGAGNDTINAGDGNDTITGGIGNDTIDSGWGNDTIYYSRGDGNDTISDTGMWDTDDRLVLSDINPGDVTLVRNGNDVTLVIAESTAGAGDGGSIMLQGNLNEYYQTGLEKVVFADGTIWTRDTMRAAVLAEASTSGNDVITGFNAADIINAGAGNDTINAGDGNDTITGGIGNDTIDSGWGNDTIYYSRGDGNETISDSGMWDTDDRLVLSGINPGDVTLVRNGNDVTLVIAESAAGAGDGGSILLQGNLNEYYQSGLEKIVFADGTIWTRADMLTHIAYTGGTVGNDIITGSSAADVLRAGLGNDTLKGGAGSDAYIYLAGDGNDIIDEPTSGTDSDVLRLDDLLKSQVLFARSTTSASDLIITVLATGETITLKNQFDTAGGVESIVFKDGEVLGGAAGALDTALTGLLAIYGTSGNDTLAGTTANDIIDAGAGDDRLEGKEGTDTYIYRPADGNDVIFDYRGSRDNRLVLGLGIDASDVVFARVAADSNDIKLAFRSMSGSITLDGQLWSDAGVEFIQFADGTVWNETEMLRRYVADQQTSGNDIIWGTNLSDLATGGAGDDTLTTFGGNDRLVGGTGNDRLDGSGGTDVYVYEAGDGDDVIFDYTGSRDNVLEFRQGISSADVVFSRVASDAADIKLTFRSLSGSIVLDNQHWGDAGVEFIRFADGTLWDDAEIARRYVADQKTAGDDTIWATNLSDNVFGGAGNDTIVAYDGNDRLIGEAGNDRLDGGGGNDVYVYNGGDGDDAIFDYQSSRNNVLEFGAGISAADVVFSRVASDAADMKLTFQSMAGSIVLDNQHWGDAGVEFIRFADGTIWDDAEIARRYVAGQTTDGDDTIWATNLSDNVVGGAGNDTIAGYDGNDRLAGGAGNDRLDGGGGNDVYVYNVGDGDDAIFDYQSSRNNVLEFGAGIAVTDVVFSHVTSDVNDMKLSFQGMTGSIVVDNQLWGDAGVEFVRFADGTVWNKTQIAARYVADQQTAGDDIIWGTYGADTIQGGAGNDTLRGVGGNDTFVFKADFGKDTVTDFSAGAGIGDVLDISDDLFADFASVMAAATQVGADTLITHDANTSITLKNVALTSLHQDDFRFTAAA